MLEQFSVIFLVVMVFRKQLKFLFKNAFVDKMLFNRTGNFIRQSFRGSVQKQAKETCILTLPDF